MIDVRTAHTADLDRAALAAARSLLDAVFASEMTESDWEHALGGIHALAWDGGELVGHASVVQRRLVYGGRALRTGYVEGVAVHPGRRRAGVGAAVMRELERVISGAYELGALATTDEGIPFYTSLGWRQWTGPAWALTPDGRVRTVDADGAVYVLFVGEDLDVTAPLVADWRDGDVW